MDRKRCDFRVKTINSDFLVTEVPLLPNFDPLTKKYTYIWLKKSNYTTFEALNPGQVGFFVSTYNSYLWNIAVSKYIKESLKSKKYIFPDLGELHLPIITESTLSSPFMISGYRFNKETFVAEEAKIFRDMILPTVVFARDIKNDEIYAGKKRILLTYFIFTGCYATMVAKQIVKTALEEEND